MSEWWFISSSSCCRLYPEDPCQARADPCRRDDKPPEQPAKGMMMPWAFVSVWFLVFLIIIFALAIICLGVPGKDSKPPLPSGSEGKEDQKSLDDAKPPKDPMKPDDTKPTDDAKAPDNGKPPEDVPDSLGDDDLDDDPELPKKRKEPKIDGISLDLSASKDNYDEKFTEFENGGGDCLERIGGSYCSGHKIFKKL